LVTTGYLSVVVVVALATWGTGWDGGCYLTGSWRRSNLESDEVTSHKFVVWLSSMICNR
jgi:hypothetical protein